MHSARAKSKGLLVDTSAGLSDDDDRLDSAVTGYDSSPVDKSFGSSPSLKSVEFGLSSRHNGQRGCDFELEVFSDSEVGRGAFCKALKATDRWGRIYAIKVPIHESSRQVLDRERVILDRMLTLQDSGNSLARQTQGVVRYHGAYRLGLLFDYYPFTLESYIRRLDLTVYDGYSSSVNEMTRDIHSVYIGRRLWTSWAVDLCIGLQFIHDCGIVHCDIKSANVFISSELRPLIGDFSSAMQVNDEQSESNLSDTAFSIQFTAPELVTMGQNVPTAKSDIFSLGSVLLQAATGQEPYSLANKGLTQKMIWAQRGMPLNHLSDECSLRISQVRPILDMFLQQRPDDRRSLREILEVLTSPS